MHSTVKYLVKLQYLVCLFFTLVACRLKVVVKVCKTTSEKYLIKLILISKRIVEFFCKIISRRQVSQDSSGKSYLQYLANKDYLLIAATISNILWRLLFFQTQ